MLAKEEGFDLLMFQIGNFHTKKETHNEQFYFLLEAELGACSAIMAGDAAAE